MKLNKPLVFFDLETTGTDISKDRIVQMYFRKLLPDGKEDTFTTLVNPGVKIPEEASRIHGITDEMVKNEKSFRELAPGLHVWLQGADLVGYNSDYFDIPLLGEEFSRAGYEYPEKDVNTIDVFQIEKKVNSRKLSETYKRYTGKNLDNAHDAGADVLATIEVFRHQMKRENCPGSSVDEIIENMKDHERVDWAGKLKRVDGVVCFNFGKHMGEAVVEHVDYVEWMLNQNFPEETKRCLREVVCDL